MQVQAGQGHSGLWSDRHTQPAYPGSPPARPAQCENSGRTRMRPPPPTHRPHSTRRPRASVPLSGLSAPRVPPGPPPGARTRQGSQLRVPARVHARRGDGPAAAGQPNRARGWGGVALVLACAALSGVAVHSRRPCPFQRARGADGTVPGSGQKNQMRVRTCWGPRLSHGPTGKDILRV